MWFQRWPHKNPSQIHQPMFSGENLKILHVEHQPRAQTSQPDDKLHIQMRGIWKHTIQVPAESFGPWPLLASAAASGVPSGPSLGASASGGKTNRFKRPANHHWQPPTFKIIKWHLPSQRGFFVVASQIFVGVRSTGFQSSHRTSIFFIAPSEACSTLYLQVVFVLYQPSWQEKKTNRAPDFEIKVMQVAEDWQIGWNLIELQVTN